MYIKLNNRNVDLEDLRKFVTLARKKFEIEIIHNENEWLQISCEDFVISLAHKNNEKIQYFGDLKKSKLYNVIYSYYSNPDDFIIKGDYLNKRVNQQSSIKSFKNLFSAFLISLLLMVIQCIFIVMKSRNYGSVFEKILGYYCDNSITPYQKSLPIGVFVFFIFSIIYGIKAIKEKRFTGKK